MNDCTTHPPIIQAASVASAPASSVPRLELQAILFEHGTHYAAVRIGGASRMLPLGRQHLESFGAFEVLLKAEGIAARHPRTTSRQAIRDAFARGAA